MEDSPAWGQLITAIDSVLEGAIDNPTKWLSQLRDNWILDQSATNLIANGQMIDASNFAAFDHDLLVRKTNLIGFDLSEADLLTDDDYTRVARHLAHYWYSKGTPRLIDFLGFILNSTIQVQNLWSTTGPTPDTYGTFLPEGDPGIGTPVWQGGTWFPTTHVRITYDPTAFNNYTLQKLTALFYAIANYNLVLESVVLNAVTYIHTSDSTSLDQSIILYPMTSVDYTIVAA
jgi:hypothetical protein